MAFYLLNSPVLTEYGQWDFEGPLTLEDARDAIPSDFISAIGHTSTAQVLGQLTGLDILTNRIQIHMLPHDRALVLRLKSRLTEGHILSESELQALPYDMGLLTRLA